MPSADSYSRRFCNSTGALLIQIPIGLVQLDEQGLQIARELVAGDRRIDLGEHDHAVVVRSAGPVQERLGQGQRQARRALVVGVEINRVVLLVADALRHFELSAGRGLLADARRGVHVLIQKTVGAAGGELAADRIARVHELGFGKRVDVELALGFHDRRPADDRRIDQHAHLRRVHQRAHHHVIERHFQRRRRILQLLVHFLLPPGHKAAGQFAAGDRLEHGAAVGYRRRHFDACRRTGCAARAGSRQRQIAHARGLPPARDKPAMAADPLSTRAQMPTRPPRIACAGARRLGYAL